MSETAEKLIFEELEAATGKLDLSWLGIDKLPESIKQLEGLNALNLGGNGISDISFLEGLNNLKSLELGSNKIRDFSLLERFKKLEYLDLNYTGLSNVYFLDNLLELRVLNLSENKIVDYQPLRSLKHLHTLYLNRNKISDASFLEGINGLKILHLNYNRILDCGFLDGLLNLKEVYINRNLIETITISTDLKNLHTWEVNDNQVVSIILQKEVSSLKTLDLSGNQVRDVGFLKKLSGPVEVNLSSNKISKFNIGGEAKQLKALDLNGNQITEVDFLNTLPSLQTLKVSNNRLKNECTVNGSASVKSMDFSQNEISKIIFLEKLSNLSVLILSRNKLETTGFVSHLEAIEEIDLQQNWISDISPLCDLNSIRTLDLSENRISDITGITNLSNLKILNLSHNQISDIGSLESMIGIESINLSNNEISNLWPLEVLIRSGLSLELSFLSEGILIGKNPITSPPISIVEDGTNSVLNWMDQMKEQGEAPLYEAKVMILGQGGAGKTTFANLQINPNYNIEDENPGSTLGIEIYEGVTFFHQHEDHMGQKIGTNLWDFGGQNIQKMLHQFFITEDCMYILVTDKRKENTDFDYWFQIIDLLGPGSPVIVLENQTGAVGNNESFALNKYQRLFKGLDINKEEVNLAKTRGHHKTRWAKLNGLIEEKLSKLEIVNRNVPTRWSNVRVLLQELKSEKYIRLDRFYELCDEEPILLSKEQAHLCLLYLRALGEVVYFEDKELRNFIFLDHNWLTEGVYYILSDTEIESAKGRFTRKQAFNKWESRGYTEESKSMLLRLMLKNQFDLCYEVNDDLLITPLLLPNDRPKNLKSVEADLYFRFQYGFMPHGMFSRAIVRLHEKIDGQKRWKSGVILKDSLTGARAEVLQFNDPKENQQVIDVKISGTKSGCKGLLDFVRENIEHLHKEFKNLTSQRKVGCNCHKCQELKKSDNQPSFYQFKELTAMLRNGVYFVRCPNDNYKDVNIGQILSEVVIEDAGEKSIDNELLYRLKEMGMSFNQIKTEAKVDMSGARVGGDANASSEAISEASAVARAKAEAKAKVNVEIQSLRGDTEVLKEDIERELKIKNVPDEEIALAVSDVQAVESALTQMEEAESIDAVPAKSKSRLKRFIGSLSNPDSTMHKTLKMLREGKDHGVQLAETYNKIASNFAMPLVPPAALEVIKSI